MPHSASVPQERTILHIDMDAFYASVEQRENPELVGKPVIIGSAPDKRGVVSAASYEARKYGVHSAMPSRTAGAKCPHGVFIRPRMALYAEVSRSIHEIFHRFTPLVESLSLDEAFLDVTASRRIFGDGVAIGTAIRDAIRSELTLPASVGVAPNKFLAKLGSDLEKPNGFVVLRADNAATRIAGIPIRRLWGVGKMTAPKLNRLGYNTFGDLQRASPAQVRADLGEHGLHLRKLTLGLDDRPVIPESEAKSIGREVTFSHDEDDRSVVRSTLYRLAEDVGARVRRAGLQARRISLKLRFDTFETVTRDVTLGAPTNSEEVIFSEAWRLALALQWPRPRVRLVGVSTSHFQRADEQLLLFGESPTEDARVARVVDAIRAQWGPTSITHAAAMRSVREKDRRDG